MNGLQLLLAQRAQHLALGYTPEVNAGHDKGELARAALAMLLIADYHGQQIGICDVDLLVKFINPWHNTPQLIGLSRAGLLTEAAALLVAELERLHPATFSPDDRPTEVVLTAIGDFARATGNIGRIANTEQRLKVVRLLGDFATHLVNQIDAELNRVVQNVAGGKNGHHKPEEEN